MGRAWTDHPSWEVVREASEAAGRELRRLLIDATSKELEETRNAQLATVTFSLVVLDAVERLGIEPTAIAGHSVGEYTALAAAGILGFEDTIRVVAERGEAMQAAADAHRGIMLLLRGCDAETADIACRLADGEVWLANVNSPAECVIAGQPEAVRRAGHKARELGARKTKALAVAGAFHTPLMAPARERLAKAISSVTFHDPTTPVIANVDGRVHDQAADWPPLLLAQITSPVRWHTTMLRLGGVADAAQEPQSLFIELGPGDALCQLARQSLPGATTVAVNTPDDLDHLVQVVGGSTALEAYAAQHQGEHLYVSERVVISPAAGIFEPAEEVPMLGSRVEVGTLIGRVSASEVRSPFEGTFQGLLAVAGERVQPGQPIAWLHS
jgi:[acyl-carrier-protein] S-malonyltransferase